ncbi:MAG: von Willebrand factor type A domain-containing protein [bacterium]|nr:von Willebrand factor type A domain-containing protein [bacterium]
MIVVVITSFGFPTTENKEVTGIVMLDGSKSPIGNVNVKVKYTNISTTTDSKGKFQIEVIDESSVLVFSKHGYVNKEVLVGQKEEFKIFLKKSMDVLSDEDEFAEIAAEEVKVKRSHDKSRKKSSHIRSFRMSSPMNGNATMGAGYASYESGLVHNTEEYDAINENIFHAPTSKPLSTFSIDVDAASYSNVRRFLNNGQMPPKDAVRIEEMINYFNYDYEQPKGITPFSINTEVGVAPWNEKHQLVHIGIQGKEIPVDNLPASNLVFLIDVSGSMSAPNKLPLLKSAFRLLTDQMRAEDKVSIVVYAGAAGTVLDPTSGNEKAKIIAALEQLQAGGSTAGGAGIQLAYKLAKENFVEGGNNRIILATDGDFNVGSSSNGDMQRLIEEKRKDGVFLTVLGFGMGNYKDSKMETLADKGNGNYAYIDNILEAKKVLVNEFGGTMFTIAKDVKIQVEFNPAVVQAYRLIGYENRKLNDEDFNDDKKDAGELGSGHTVTALYEIIPVGVDSEFSAVDELKYQKTEINSSSANKDEMMTVKLRYKDPDGDKSKLISEVIKNKVAEKASENFNWSAAVASFGMILRDSEFKGDSSYPELIKLAQAAKGEDKEGYRIELIKLIKSGQLLGQKD